MLLGYTDMGRYFSLLHGIPLKTISLFIHFAILGISVVFHFYFTNNTVVNILSVSPGAHMSIFLGVKSKS